MFAFIHNLQFFPKLDRDDQRKWQFLETKLTQLGTNSYNMMKRFTGGGIPNFQSILVHVVILEQLHMLLLKEWWLRFMIDYYHRNLFFSMAQI